MATAKTVDFSRVPETKFKRSGKSRDKLPPNRPLSADGKVLTPKQIRARARRKMKRAELLSDQEMEYLYRKPIEDWDLEELARGRPRNAQGHFKGPSPKWVSAVVHEEAMAKYTAAVKSSMRATTVDALGIIKELINDDNVDDKGKPIVPASTKLDAAKFLIEHVVGKPTQRIENDVSIKLQAILGQVMVNPSDLTGSYAPGHYPGITMELATADRDDDDDELFGD